MDNTTPQEALKAAQRFIRNGIEMGYIRMPDADTPDPAHKTLPMIEAALAALDSAQQAAQQECTGRTCEGCGRHG